VNSTELSLNTTIFHQQSLFGEGLQVGMLGGTGLTVYELGSYEIQTKDARPDKDTSIPATMSRMQAKYQNEGLRRVVEALMLVHVHGHPHVLLQQQGKSWRL
jgi:hypothetical protein